MKGAISRREFLRGAAAGVAALGMSGIWARAAAEGVTNIVFIMTDDLGYTDLGCYGAKEIKTPNLDGMAGEGLRFTDYHTPAGVCTPTRAALMTGCYPKRVGLHVAVLAPTDFRGLNPSEITIAEVLKGRGYATAIIGKWHLGVRPEFLPTKQGFDSYFGMPGPNHGASDLYRNETMIAKNAEVNLDEWTADCTKEAVKVIRENKGKPFFLYLSHGAPHIPLHASARFRGKSAHGLYGDVIEEIDWSVGEVLKALKEEGLEEKTLVIFSSDNGPSGQAAPPWHGGKGSTWEGGHRVPLIARWKGRIPEGKVTGELVATMDFYPTLAGLAGAALPGDRVIDGVDFAPVLLGEAGAKSRRTTLLYDARDGKLAAIREGKWKLHVIEPSERWAGKLPVAEALLDKKPAGAPPWLYDLEADPGETKDVAAEHPEVVERLKKMLAEMDAKLEKEARPVGVVPGGEGQAGNGGEGPNSAQKKKKAGTKKGGGKKGQKKKAE